MALDREDTRSISLPVVRIHQPIGDFYIGCIKSKDLREICWFDIRELRRQDGRLDDFFGIQRELSKKRVNEIKQYVQNIDATFPTGVIISVDEVCASLTPISVHDFADRFSILTLSNYQEPDDEADRIHFRHIARVIDGQHRIAGLEDYQSDDFEINVVIFVGADLADQASIFATVNLAQTKVNRSLVYDLFSLSQNRSPQKTCHEIVVTLDREPDSPFFKKIKRLGTATKPPKDSDGRIIVEEIRSGETLSQATVVKALLKYISKEPGKDQDLLRRGKKIPDLSREDAEKLIFRDFFARAEDERIADVIWNYFDAVKDRWPTAWNSTGTGFMLNRTNGFNALMRFLRPAYRYFTTSGQSVSTDEFSSLFSKVSLKDKDFNADRYKPGTSGETALYYDLMQQVGLSDV
ncbi:DGQHR domain-containing protein [uncultured Reyranella sp.]|jgi:DGQHR domain-containing protein|uniref:DGQHR domain-containing protein n=1 Tax=uncultured Reyranella sp. TaxID=735512 RepID=UPI00259CE58C|nr:DGQHR domain-containing protein [uncultured Reyranella sp.]